MVSLRTGLTLLGLLTVCPAAQPAAYIDRECGFRFSYDRRWILTREPIPGETEPCGYAIIFAGKGPKGAAVRHLVNIYLSDYEFERFENETDAWFQKDGKWYQNNGVAGTGDAYPIHGKNWVGMSSPDGPARCYDDHYSGAGWSPTASLFSATLKRRADLDGGLCEKADKKGLELIIPGFEFIPRK